MVPKQTFHSFNYLVFILEFIQEEPLVLPRLLSV